MINNIKSFLARSQAQGVLPIIAKRLEMSVDRLANKQFYEFPLGSSQKANANSYLEIWKEAKQIRYPQIDLLEKKLGFSIDENWFQDLALLTQVVIKKSNICYQHGRLLYSALSSYLSQNNDNVINIVETGTARGFSTLCMAKAIKDAGRQGKIVTFDVLPHDVEMYWNCIADETGPKSRSALLNTYSQLIEESIIFVQGDSKIQLKKVSMPRIHFAFIDGAHTYEYILNEFNFIKNKQQKGDMLFFDDYTPSLFPGIVKAVDEICDKYDYSKDVITVSEQRGYVIAQKL